MENEMFEDETPQEEIQVDTQEGYDDTQTGYIDNPDEYVQRTGKPRETFRSKKEYDEFGALKDELKAVRDELKNWKTTAQMTASMYTTVDQKAYERAYNEIQEKVAENYAMGDTQAAQAAQQELTQLQQADHQKRLAVQQEQLRRIEQDFVERNKDWYNEQNPDLQRKAHFLVDKYKLTPNITADQIVKMVETEIREFELPKKQKAGSTPNISRTTSGGNKIAQAATSRLPASKKAAFEEQKAVMTSMGVKNYTEADFVAYLKRYGDI